MKKKNEFYRKEPKMYYLSILGKEMGPFTLEELQELVKQGRIEETVCIRTETGTTIARELLRDSFVQCYHSAIHSNLRACLIYSVTQLLAALLIGATILREKSLAGAGVILILYFINRSRLQKLQTRVPIMSPANQEYLTHCTFAHKFATWVGIVLILVCILICTGAHV